MAKSKNDQYKTVEDVKDYVNKYQSNDIHTCHKLTDFLLEDSNFLDIQNKGRDIAKLLLPYPFFNRFTEAQII